MGTSNDWYLEIVKKKKSKRVVVIHGVFDANFVAKKKGQQLYTWLYTNTSFHGHAMYYIYWAKVITQLCLILIKSLL